MMSVTRSANYATLQIKHRHQIWRLSVDGVFHSDYRSRADAEECCAVLAQDFRAQGNLVTVVGLTP